MTDKAQIGDVQAVGPVVAFVRMPLKLHGMKELHDALVLLYGPNLRISQEGTFMVVSQPPDTDTLYRVNSLTMLVPDE